MAGSWGLGESSWHKAASVLVWGCWEGSRPGSQGTTCRAAMLNSTRVSPSTGAVPTGKPRAERHTSLLLLSQRAQADKEAADLRMKMKAVPQPGLP